MALKDISDDELRRLYETQAASIERHKKNIKAMEEAMLETCCEMLRRWGNAKNGAKHGEA